MRKDHRFESEVNTLLETFGKLTAKADLQAAQAVESDENGLNELFNQVEEVQRNIYKYYRDNLKK